MNINLEAFNMRKFLSNIQKFGKDEDGAAMVEYVVLLGLLLAVSLAVLTTMGGQINTIFTSVSTALAAVIAA
jgi:pilus assembly protein Flp/PilA